MTNENDVTKWIPLDRDLRGYADEFKCSECGAVVQTPYYITDVPDFNFCPYCGKPVHV